ncbi:MAG: PD-(D/E)XK nuclease family protein [Bacteroidales bacterium]|nr:PD-(D/E)XK nuclease family protein [Bacteroidales bacterium]
MKFLEKLAKQLVNNHDDFSRIAIVLPGRRAGRILLKYIAIERKKTFFAPTIFTIDEFIESLSSRKKVSDEELLKRLYVIYKETAYSNDKTFSMFYPWAETFLQDINEVDLQLADAQAIFSNLSEIKELEISFAKQELSDNQRKYLAFYRNLYDLYAKLNQQLEEAELAYSGAIYKNVALNIAEYAEKDRFEKVYFAGLSAFTPAEFAIIDHFLSSKGAEIFFDFDPFYENSTPLLIGKIKRNLSDIPLNWVANDYQTIPKKIKEVAVSGMYNQIYYAIRKIKEIEVREGSLDDTALVFADEQLILPLLHAYFCENANLTMGYPFSETAAVHLAKHYINLIKNSFRFQEIRNTKDTLYYYKDIVTILENPMVCNLLSTNKSQSDTLKFLKNNNKSFYSFEEINQINAAILFPKPEKGVFFIEELIRIFQSLSQAHTGKDNLAHPLLIVQQLLSEVYDFLKDMPSNDFDFSTVGYFFDKKTRQLSIPLRGEYDKGLQVMGLLESRALDFKNVILLSVNEGVLPSNTSQNSLILFDLKRHFNLPLIREKETVFAYHFFRLLQRAEDITLIYNEDASDSLAERSRFIAQLHYEIEAQHCGNIRYEKEHFSVNIPDINSAQIIVKKDEKVLDILCSKKYSASLLSKYINCPLQFYFQGVLGLKPPQTISEEMEQNIMGTIIHAVMENVVNQIIENPSEKKNILKSAIHGIEAMVLKKIADVPDLKNVDLEKGKPFLYTEIIKKYLLNYLNIMLHDDDPIDFISCEKNIDTQLDINGQKITVTGVIDRIDRKGSEVRILDYKTGKVSKEDLTANDMQDIFTSPELNKLFQLMMYLYLYCKDLETNEQKIPDAITLGIVSFIQLNKDKQEKLVMPTFKDYVKNDISYRELYDLFANGLSKLFSEILDENQNFVQTQDEKRCRYCDFLAVCGRGTS